MKDFEKQKQKQSEIRKLNNIGERILFCRKHLKLDRNELAVEAGMHPSSLAEREQGSRSQYYEEFLTLSEALNAKWREKFTTTYPRYLNVEIKQITPMFLMFGITE